MKEIFGILGMAAFLGILIYWSIIEHQRQQMLIDSGFCQLVFTEDDGDENYRCDDGVTFERDYD